MADFDKYPQWFKMRLAESSAHTYTKLAFETPVIAGGSNYYIMEVCKAYLELLLADGAQVVTVKETGGHIQITRDEHNASLLSDHEDLIFYYSSKIYSLTSGALGKESRMIDLTDGDGNGFLIADKEIWFAVAGDSDNASAIIGGLWFLYKLVKVSANELLDMLQTD